VLILGGLVVAYFAAYFGDGLHALTVADNALSIDQQFGWGVAAVMLGIVMIIVGGLAWVRAMRNFLSSLEEDSDEVVAASAIVGFICISCLFGILAGPFANYSAYPLNWLSRWSWLPILAFVPIILVLRDAFSSMMATRREKISKNNVATLRRDSA
jgi:hypothetical protein